MSDQLREIGSEEGGRRIFDFGDTDGGSLVRDMMTSTPLPADLLTETTRAVIDIKHLSPLN